MTTLFHIVSRADWAAAVATGEYRPVSLAVEGFVHCSFAEQVEGVANALYRELDDLCVVELDPGALDAEVVVEDSYGTGTRFPHVYGPVPTAAALAVHEMPRDTAGAFVFNPGPAGAAASRDH